MIPSHVRKFLAIKFRVNSGNWNLSDVINRTFWFRRGFSDFLIQNYNTEKQLGVLSSWQLFAFFESIFWHFCTWVNFLEFLYSGQFSDVLILGSIFWYFTRYLKLWSRFIFKNFSLFAFKSKVNVFHMFFSFPLLFATNFTLMVSKLQSFKIEVFMWTDWFSKPFRFSKIAKIC